MLFYVVIDVETTGGNPKNSKITEIAMYKTDGISIFDEFISLVNPEIPIPPFIVRLTGISDQMVSNAPTFPEIATRIIEFTEGCVFVAHNVGFDYAMIRAEFKSLGYVYSRPYLCTVKSARILIPGHDSYSLGKISKDLGIKITGRHRAGGDALATTELFKIMYLKNQLLLETQIGQAASFVGLHPLFDVSFLEELPNKIGVYIFYTEWNQPIYVGKSKHLKKRIEQHLSSLKSKKAAKMRSEITRVEIELMGSELIALLKESQLIKSLKPIYNRMLRKTNFPVGLFLNVNQLGYKMLEIESVEKKNDVPLLKFTTKKEAAVYLKNKTASYVLCEQFSSLKQGVSEGCFGLQLKTCLGACVGKESVENYNKRVDLLLEEQSFKEDSFYILEQGRVRNEKGIVFIYKNQYVGFGFIDYHSLKAENKFWKQVIDVQKEDKDALQLISTYMRKNPFKTVVYKDSLGF